LLARLDHPAARHPAFIHAAIHPQALIDYAWHCLRFNLDPPTRHDVVSWLHRDQELQARALAESVHTAIPEQPLRSQWKLWTHEALHAPDPFYEDAPHLSPHLAHPAPVRVTIRPPP